MPDMLNIKVERQPDIRFQDGALPHAAGVKSYQIMRANRAHPELSDGFGWTYNHAPMLAYYHDRFYVEYLSNPVSEHETPGQTLMSSSTDGINWSFPQVAFPIIEVSLKDYLGPKAEKMPDTIKTVPHQRMGFYRADNDVMLVLSFYGIVHDRKISAPCDGWGVGRAVRRIYPDGSLGNIYFLMYNKVAGYTRENTKAYPYFEESEDAALIYACRQLLSDRPVVNQMYEEQRNDKALFPVPLRQAASFYTVNDGEMVTVFKHGVSMRSEDGGKTWGEIVPNYSLKTSTGKVWGQKTADGRFALLYNPTPDGQHRWPIACVTGKDGYSFGNMVSITGLMSPERYGGIDKNLGPQYLRGICERNPQVPDGKIHLVYSNNKEDIWISHISVPTAVSNEACISEDFSDGAEKWNFYSPLWAPVRLNGAITLADRDPYDRAAVERCFKPSEKGETELTFTPETISEKGEAVIGLCDERGCAPVEIELTSDCRVRLRSSGRYENWVSYEPGRELKLFISFDCSRSRFTVRLNDITKEAVFSSASDKICMLSVATKAICRIPYSTTDSNGKYGTKDMVLPGAGEYISETRIRLNAFMFKAE